MSNYPNSIDDSTTLPPATGDDAISVNAVIAAAEAIETELGILPSGVYANVRARLDILEARINNPFAPAPDVLNPFYIGNSGVTIQTNMGDPNILHILAQPGSLYLRQDGYQNVYVFRPDGYWHDVEETVVTINIQRTITGNYTVDSLSPDFIIFCNASTPITIHLASATPGRQLIFKDISGNASTNHITIIPFGSQKVENQASLILQSNFESITLGSDGDQNWWQL